MKHIAAKQFNEIDGTFRGLVSALGEVPTLDQLKAEAAVPEALVEAYWSGDYTTNARRDPT